MLKRILFSLMILICIFSAGIINAAEPLKIAEIGPFKLESGIVLKSLKIGYRTAGILNQEKSNAVLFPTWFSGTSDEISALGFTGPGKMADTGKYFVIMLDNPGNGISSSPSNTESGKGESFPEFTMRDMVRAQYTFLTDYMKLKNVYAIIGISMGGMQVFQWTVSYPDYMKKAVSISGTPGLTSADILLWNAELMAVEEGAGGDISAMKRVAPLHILHMWTPQYFAKNIKINEFQQFFISSEKGILKYNPKNWKWQIKAMLSHDVYKSSNNTTIDAPKSVHAKVMVIRAEQDFMVSPEPGTDFAKEIKSENFTLPGNYGHLSFIFQSVLLNGVVSKFLEEK